MEKQRTVRIHIEGIVQGVGFRPFVYNLALRLNVSGYVHNNSNGVEVMAQAASAVLERFLHELEHKIPPQAVIDEFTVAEVIDAQRFERFEIRQSIKNATKNTRIAPDLCLCADCVQEMLDSDNRRFFYPFINCTNCGPRYTIVRDVPYDRKYTTMAGFNMCKQCQAEYDDPRNRRFHAQPNACYRCGPRLELYTAGKKLLFRGTDQTASKELIIKAAEFLRTGMIMAIKGIGGFHCACDARNTDSVKRLRSLKYREERAFAVMVKDLKQAGRISRVTPQAERRLQAVDRPIVIIPKALSHDVAQAVAPNNKNFGIMLPYAPLHYLLFEYIDFPLVMTSGNISEEPIAHANHDAFTRLSKLCDYFLVGNRDIHIRCDDSVTRIWKGAEYMLRRSRGLAPNPVPHKAGFKRPLLAVGAEQKNTICLAKKNKAFLSHHIGDLKNQEAYASFVQAIKHLQSVLDVSPQAVAYDPHPQYLSTQCVHDPPPELAGLNGLPRIPVQHHHAHIASCMAEHNLSERVIGVALDGTGLGSDNTIWGGELLVTDLTRSEKAGGLTPFLLPGGDKVISQPWRTAVSLLYQVYEEKTTNHLPSTWKTISQDELSVVLYQIAGQKQSPLSSSCGRLFDAVSALAGVCVRAAYQGQPAIELEQVIENDSAAPYILDVVKTRGSYYLSWHPLVKQVAEDCRNGVKPGIIAYRFHMGLAAAFSGLCGLISDETGIKKVVLSGGCFMNMFLLTALDRSLQEKGLQVFTHSMIPCNDGGIALGQAVVANQLLKEK
ncbi:MAG: carbamoyltransferase HypF [Spirochaetales bacterium]|nr:carbamoyltransferase HypF [Spirochaetales bacterium]